MPRPQSAAASPATPEPVVHRPSAGEAAPAEQSQATNSYTAKRYAVRGEKDAYEPPRTDTEKFIVDVFQTVLGIDNLGIRENFFRIGGNSLVALQVITRIRRAYSVRVPVRRFFDGPTPGEIAAYVDAERKQQKEVAAS
jgi:acyl carrier protein